MRIEPLPIVNRAERVALDRPATLRDPSKAPIDVLIDNLSTTGALLRGQGSLPVGTLVSLGIAGLGIQIARITRIAPGEFAAEFMLPLDPEKVAAAKIGSTLVSVAFPQLPIERHAAARVIPDPKMVSPETNARSPRGDGIEHVGLLGPGLTYEPPRPELPNPAALASAVFAVRAIERQPDSARVIADALAASRVALSPIDRPPPRQSGGMPGLGARMLLVVLIGIAILVYLVLR